MADIKITLKKSLIGCSRKQKEAVRVLGLRKINHQVQFKDSPALRGQIRVVRHMVDLDEKVKK